MHLTNIRGRMACHRVTTGEQATEEVEEDEENETYILDLDDQENETFLAQDGCLSDPWEALTCFPNGYGNNY